MLIEIFGAKCIGIDAIPVTVEVNITSGIGIHLVGLADAAVRESLLRTVTALQTLGFRIPGKKIVINLAPADMHKNGSGYDLPIAIGIIAASKQCELPKKDRFIIMGELGLDGSVRPVPGALPISELAANSGLDGCILPKESAQETINYRLCSIYGVSNLSDVIRILEGKENCNDLLTYNNDIILKPTHNENIYDFADIYGQEGAKRGLEIAAAGGHNVIMVGPPGAGKSTLAKAMAGILPPMSLEESIQTSKIYSVSGKENRLGIIRKRPFRSPHYNTSATALLGGGSDRIIPGELSLAHNGILFLDEFCEMPRRILESLRSPIEDRSITISRLRTKVTFPASFMLVAATNPCPCGYYGDGDKCTCSPSRREAYLERLSGPIMDRIDIHLWVNPVNKLELIDRKSTEPTQGIAQRVAAARDIQKKRFSGKGIFTNAEMTGKMTGEFCSLNHICNNFMKKLIDNMDLSARAYHRILKIARTIADLEGCEDISLSHISEASGYRFLDKRSNGII